MADSAAHTPDEDWALHLNPLRRDRADFIIAADIAETGLPKRFEQLWARQLGEWRFEICCIPAFAYDLALEDVVETAPRGDVDHVITRVVEPSGHFTFRAWLGDIETEEHRVRALGHLKNLGAELEFYSDDLVAIDATDEDHAQAVATKLQRLEDDGTLTYETGRTA